MESIIWLVQVYSEYYLIFFWCVLCGVVYCMKASKKTKYAIYGVAAYIPLALFCGLRDASVGADTVTYCEWYSRFENVSVDGWLYRNFECGWVYLNKMLYWISPDPQMLLIFTSLVTTFGMGLFFFKTSPNFYLSTVLFVGFFYRAVYNNTAKFCLGHSTMGVKRIMAWKKSILRRAGSLGCIISRYQFDFPAIDTHSEHECNGSGW